jgi:hypothetical protein
MAGRSRRFQRLPQRRAFSGSIKVIPIPIIAPMIAPIAATEPSARPEGVPSPENMKRADTETNAVPIDHAATKRIAKVKAASRCRASVEFQRPSVAANARPVVSFAVPTLARYCEKDARSMNFFGESCDTLALR